MEKNNMTAVEWLVKKLSIDILDEIPLDKWDKISDAVQQAIQMEKEQRIGFAKHCLDKALDLDINTAFFNAEKYYNETYGR